MRVEIRKLLEHDILTAREVAERLDVSQAAIKQRYQRKQVDGILKGKTVLFDRDDFPELRISNQ